MDKIKDAKEWYDFETKDSPIRIRKEELDFYYMQQYAEYKVSEEKRIHELEKLAEYNRGFKDGVNSDAISITKT